MLEVLTLKGCTTIRATTRTLVAVSTRPAPARRTIILELPISRRKTVSPQVGRSHNVSRRRAAVGSKLVVTTALTVIPCPYGVSP